MLTFALTALILNPLTSSETTFYKNTDELVGVVGRWPRGAALVFENQIQLVECDSIDAIEAWSTTHLKLRTVFGDFVEIDVRKVRRVDFGIWSRKPSSITEVDFNSLKGKFVGPATQAAGYVGQPGICSEIGISPNKKRWFSVVEEAKATRVQSEDGRVRIFLPKNSSPVMIKDSGNYLAIMPGNSRFAPLKVFTGKTSRTLVSDAQTFYALRTKAAPSGR